MFEKIAPGGLISVQVARRKWAQAHADEVARFVGALKRAFDYNNIHQQEARKRLTQHTKINEKLAKAISWPVMKLSVEHNDLQVPMDLSVKYGLLKQPVPIVLLNFRRRKTPISQQPRGDPGLPENLKDFLTEQPVGISPVI